VKIFKRTMTLLIAAALIGFLALAGCASGARPVQREAGKVYELVLLHTNDHHGTVLPIGGRGGLAERAAFINSVRSANSNVLLLDAGDINTGTALSNMFGAEPDILAYNIMGYDAVAIGNHEMSWGREQLERQIATANFPFFASNVRQGRGFLGGHQYLVRDFEGFRVGIFTLTTLRTLEIASPGDALFASVEFLPEIETARSVAEQLRSRHLVDIVIALTHIGDVREADDHVTSLDLAAAVPGIDIIVDGHSHSLFAEPVRVGNTLVVSAGERGAYVGKARISIVDGGIVGFDWEPVAIRGFAPDAQIAAILAPFIERADASLREVIGRSTANFDFGNRRPRYGETAIGNMISDGLAWYIRNVFNQSIDFAFTNGGGIRADLPGGDLTREDILTVLPFENYLHVVSLSGSELLELFDFIAAIPQGAGGFPQFSAEVRYTLNVPARTISNLTIGGVPIDPNRIYRFGVHDFLLGGGDGFTILTRSGDRLNTAMLLSDIVIDYINRARGGVITPATDGRMVVIGGVTP